VVIAEAAKLVDRAKAYDVAEAVALTKKTNTAKFDATVVLAILKFPPYVVIAE
jgi:large subunit ribosomal protein L1